MMPKKHAPRYQSKKTRADVIKSLRSTTAKSVYVVVLGTALLICLFLVAVTPERYHLKVGDISHATITASKDVVDEIETAKQREAAARLVEPSYLYKEGVSDEVLLDLQQVLSQLTTVQQYGRQTLEQQASDEDRRKKTYIYKPAEVEYASSLLTLLSLSDYQLITLLNTTDEQMAELTLNVTSAVENTMNTTIREGHISESIQYLQQIIGYKTNIDLLQNVVTPVLRKCVKPNMLIDQDATAKLEEDARAAVEPVIYKQGQNIVLKSERVTKNQLEMLRSLGLLDDDNVDITMYLGGAGLVLLVMSALMVFLRLFDEKTLQRPKRLTILMIALTISFAVCILGQEINTYLTPSLLAAMMLTGLLGAPAGVAGALTMGVLTGAVVAGGDSTVGAESLTLALISVISGLAAVLALRDKPYRQQVLLCALITAACNMAIVLSIGVMTNNSTSDVLINGLWSMGSTLVASLLCLGLDPVLESLFHLATPSKLLELCNPNQPLLRRLLIEASGTYHHSIIVANLAEAAAEAIGANPLLARAGAYFHDIGKLKRPLYFKENQMGENPHIHTNPYVSAAIVTAHTRDGLMMAQQNHLPEEIQSIIIEHHGDTPVMYFYHRALQQADGQPVDIADFRYDGQRPHMKESAIVMLADTVEAAVRSMPDPTPSAIEEFIERLVRGKLEDGQLRDAPITLRDIDRICEAFSKVLNGVFHERIEYPAPAALEGPPAASAEKLAQEEAPENAEAPAQEEEIKEQAPEQPDVQEAPEANEETEQATEE